MLTTTPGPPPTQSDTDRPIPLCEHMMVYYKLDPGLTVAERALKIWSHHITSQNLKIRIHSISYRWEVVCTSYVPKIEKNIPAANLCFCSPKAGSILFFKYNILMIHCGCVFQSRHLCHSKHVQKCLFYGNLSHSGFNFF